ncbi:MAG: DUF4363 family protein [Clostridia bacterium]|nr:DUF4363 family protein [Clostridia bacterium]
MKTKIITMLVVLALCVAFITWSTNEAFDRLEKIDKIAVIVIDQVLSGDLETAMNTLGELANVWEKTRPFMETIMPHEDLQRIIELYTEANANLEAGDTDDFSRSIALLRETIDHLSNHEKFSWSNIL